MPLPLRICFLFNAQQHQVMHGMATAVRLARKRGVEVHVVSPHSENISLAKQIASRLGDTSIKFINPHSKIARAVTSASRGTVGTKKLTLTVLRQMLADYDAIAIPERTSLILKRMGLGRPIFVHLDHGAGDRAVGYEERIKEFDFVLVAGKKQRERMLQAGLIRHGHFAVAGYSKFEVADAMRNRDWKPFRDDRPVVLYTPHFTSLGSWQKLGMDVLRAFARQEEYNLIFAPHVRLFYSSAARQEFEDFVASLGQAERVFIDLGSERSVDMTYVELADVYVGDVSSQVYEFLRRPRPCLFLNANGIEWEGDENYDHWRFGPVANDAKNIVDLVGAARDSHAEYLPIQQAAFSKTFDERAEPPSERAATAIAKYLRREVPTRRLRVARKGNPRLVGFSRAAAAMLLIGLGWGARGEFAGPALAQPSLAMEADEARDEFAASVPAKHAIRPSLSKLAQGIDLPTPSIPAGWNVVSSDVITTEAGPVIQVNAVTQDGLQLAIIVSRNANTTNMPTVISEGNDESIASWSDGRTAYALAAQTSPELMKHLVSELHRTHSIS